MPHALAVVCLPEAAATAEAMGKQGVLLACERLATASAELLALLLGFCSLAVRTAAPSSARACLFARNGSSLRSDACMIA
jgi:hypothetical protein